MDSFDDDSYSSASSHHKEEAEADEKNVEGVGVKPAAIIRKTRKRKRTCHEKYQRSIRNLKNRVNKLKSEHATFPVLLIYKEKDQIHFVGDSDLVRAFESSNAVKQTINDALQGSTPTEINSSKKIRKSQDYLGGNALRTLVEKGEESVLRDDLRMLIVNYTTGCRKINNFWGALNEDINKPGWWPKGIPFSSPNIRERDATPGKPRLSQEQILKIASALRKDAISKNLLARVTDEDVQDEALAGEPADRMPSKVSEVNNDNATLSAPESETSKIQDVNDDYAAHSASATEPPKVSVMNDDDDDDNDNDDDVDGDDDLSALDTELTKKSVENLSQSDKEDFISLTDDCEIGTTSQPSHPVPPTVVIDDMEPKPRPPIYASTPQRVYTHLQVGENVTIESQASPNVIPRKQVQYLATQSLALLRGIDTANWDRFVKSVGELDEQFLEQCKVLIAGNREEFSMRTMPRSAAIIDRQYIDKEDIPNGMVPVTSRADGDCLFNSIGKLLFGTESVSPILRLLATVEAVKHVNHFLSEYRDRYLTIDDAQQMLYCMSSEAVYNNRPQISRSTPTEILRYAILNEVMGLTKHRAYAGLLQVRYLATVLSRNINLHCSFTAAKELYHGLYAPCLCCSMDLLPPLNLLFAPTSQAYYPNHYVPLVWKIDQRSTLQDLPQPRLVKVCAAIKRLGCQAAGEEAKKWVSCTNCLLSYHAICSGISVHKKQFTCCLPENARQQLRANIRAQDIYIPSNTRILQWPRYTPDYTKGKESRTIVELNKFDLFCIHSSGISSALVDFYIRVLQNIIAPEATVFVANTHESTQIATGTNALQNPRLVFPRDNLFEYEMVLFPFRPRESWHWVLIVFSLSQKWVTTLDSLDANATHQAYRSRFARFLAGRSVEEKRAMIKFSDISSKIPHQGQTVDCGLYMLYYIESIMTNSYNVDDQERICITTKHDLGTTMRKRIVKYIYECRKNP